MKKHHIAGRHRSASRNKVRPCELNPPLSVRAHVRLAAALNAARRTLSDEISEFPNAGTFTRRILNLQRAIDALRSELENELCALVPAKRDPRRLATRVYYGNARLIPHYRPPDDPTDDAFADWIEMRELMERKP
jgi:hypothetical protein